MTTPVSLPNNASNQRSLSAQNRSPSPQELHPCSLETAWERIHCHWQADELAQLTAALVRIPSLNPPGEEAAVTDFLEALCHREGLTCQRIPSGQLNRDNLLIVLPGQDREGLAFTGHQDVVPVSPAEAERWKRDPFSGEISEGYLHGRGSSDMKAGLMASLYGMICIRRAGILPPHDLYALITSDEENHMYGSKAIFATGLMTKIRELVVCEPTSLSLCRIGKGRTWAEIVLEGQTAHGSQAGVGQNAVDLAADFILSIRNLDWSQYANEHGQSFIRTLAVQAGVEPQVVPDTCHLTVDARLTTGHTPTRVWLDVSLLLEDLKRTYPGSGATLAVQDLREPWITSADSPVVRRAQTAAETVLNRTLPESVFAGSTDGTVLRRDGTETIILGPGDLACVHRENECVSLRELEEASLLYLQMMLQI